MARSKTAENAAEQVDTVEVDTVEVDTVEAECEVDWVGAEYGAAGPGPFRVRADFTAMVGAQLCTFKAGAVIDPLAGAELAAGGAPVEPV